MKSSTLFQELLAQLEHGWVGLADKPEETPQTTLSALWAFQGISEIEGERIILAEEELELRRLVAQRLEDVPLAYLVGHQSFMGIKFLCGPQAMIPRKETEILASTALHLVLNELSQKNPIKVVDLCSGCGNIALTVAYHQAQCHVIGADLSEGAVELARKNAQNMGLEDRVHFLQSDVFEAFENEAYWEKIDLITCNPPYISSAHVEELPGEIIGHEPLLAFDGGPFGVKILTRLVRDAPRFLLPDGYLCFEVGLGQGKMVMNLLKKNDWFYDIKAVTDGLGETRVLQARRKKTKEI